MVNRMNIPGSGPTIPGGGVLKKGAAPGIPGITTPLPPAPKVPYPTAGMFATPPKATPKTAATPAAALPNYTDYAVVGGGAGGGAAPTAVGGTDQDYLAGDSAYQAQLAALQKTLADYESDQTNQTNQYNTQYGNSLASLGYQSPAAGAVDPSTGQPTQGSWNFQDQNTAAGRSYQNQLNDFASRGELQSSGYGTALDNLTRSLDTQKGAMDTSKQSFLDNLASALSQEQNSNQLSIQQAQADAIARRAAQYGLT